MTDQDRSRSRSPVRKSKKITGFKWKEKRPRDDNESRQERAGGTLDRGYRDRSPQRWQNRDDSEHHTDQNQRKNRERYQDDDKVRQNDNREHDKYKPRRRSRSRDRDSRPTLPTEPRREDQTDTLKDSNSKTTVSDRPPKEKKKKDKPAQVPISNEPMIVVNVNDRLGTKAAIPCFASDSIKGFKAMVAAHIGRKPHEILIKRQGERPMKDILTLADYGVSNGVQLDLELDTGD